MTTLKTVTSKTEQDCKLRTEDYIRNTVTTLGIVTPVFFGWTISLPNNHLVKVNIEGRRTKVKWSFLTPSQQFNYYRDVYFPTVVKFNVDTCIGVPELNKAGNMHFHLLCADETMVNFYDMLNMRKSLNQNKTVMGIAHGDAHLGMRLNHVHYLTNLDEWIAYLEKDLIQHTFPILIIKSVIP